MGSDTAGDGPDGSPPDSERPTTTPSTVATSAVASNDGDRRAFTASAQAQTADAATSDEALVSSVKTALAAHPEFKADGLKITSKNAEVTLSGLVEDGPTLYKIALEVQKVPGVKYVMNDMTPKHD